MEEIRPNVKLETLRYGGDAATSPALVVWGHGLCNALVGESSEKLWDFWATLTHRRVVGDGADATAAATTAAAAAPAPAAAAAAAADDAAMHVVRYSARGHGASSPAEAPSDCTWETLGRDMLSLGRRLRRGGVFTPPKLRASTRLFHLSPTNS